MANSKFSMVSDTISERWKNESVYISDVKLRVLYYNGSEESRKQILEELNKDCMDSEEPIATITNDNRIHIKTDKCIGIFGRGMCYVDFVNESDGHFMMLDIDYVEDMFGVRH